jgi:MoxR-like ATPase
MSEGQVSLEGVTKALPRPFFVVATQNPLEYEGTYPLPESQLDRFLVRVRLGFPDRVHEERVLLSQVHRRPIDSLDPVLDVPATLALMASVREVRVEPALVQYVLDLVGATRRGDRFLHGASPRASLGLYRAAQALALVEGRDWCVPDDVKRLAGPVLAHRLVASPTFEGRRRGQASSVEDLFAELLDGLPVPR